MTTSPTPLDVLVALGAKTCCYPRCLELAVGEYRQPERLYRGRDFGLCPMPYCEEHFELSWIRRSDYNVAFSQYR